MIRTPRLFLLPLLLAGAARADVPPALRAAADAAEKVEPEGRELARAFVVWAAATTNQAPLVKELGSTVAKDPRSPTGAVAWVAAALARTGDAKDAATLFGQALDRLADETAGAELVEWMRAWAAAPSGLPPALPKRWLATLRARKSRASAAATLREVAPLLRAAGIDDRARDFATELLADSLSTVEDATLALAALGSDLRPAREALARAAKATPKEVDEFFCPAHVAAWRGAAGAREAARALSEALAPAGPYGPRLVRLANAQRMVDEKENDAGALVRNNLDDAWSHGGPTASGASPQESDLERLRLVVRLVEKVPQALGPAPALELLEATRVKALARERHVYVLGDELGALAEATGRLRGPGALKLAAALGDAADALRTRALADAALGPPNLSFEAVGECAVAAGAIGGEDAAALVEVLARRAAAAIKALAPEERKSAEGGLLFHPAKALTRCAAAAAKLGQADLAARCMATALAALDGAAEGDAADLLTAACDAAGGAPERLRPDLVAQVAAKLEVAGQAPAFTVRDLFRAIAAALGPAPRVAVDSPR